MMTTPLREWHLQPTAPYPAVLAADARLSNTDYGDDQIWRLVLGQHEQPALALHTSYGGRANDVQVFPIWQHNGRAVSQAQGYAVPFTLKHFAPSYLCASGQLTLTLHIIAEYWTMESHAVGARFTVRNTGETAEHLALEMSGYTMLNKLEDPLKAATLRDDSAVLLFGLVGSIQPTLMLEGGTIGADPAGKLQPHLSAQLTIPAGGEAAVRWVVAGLADMDASANLARRWLMEDWKLHFDNLFTAAGAIPQIFTGNAEQDLAIAAATQQLMQSFLRATGSLPFGSVVARRGIRDGYSQRANGADYTRAWNGQAPHLTYLAALGAAPIDAQLAQGLLRNYLAVQTADGTIDRKPGLGGQREDLLCTPLLARLAWELFAITQDLSFLSDVHAPLVKFFQRWFSPDVDGDQDGLPEWQHERQTGYVYQPTFGIGQVWAQNAPVQYTESPDLAAYLLSEALSIKRIVEQLDKPLDEFVAKRLQSLRTLLGDLWAEERFVYRERDTHTTPAQVRILTDGRGDEEQLPVLTLSPAARVIVRVEVPLRKTPSITLLISGLDSAGKAISEQVDEKAFVWNEGYGVYTTQYVYAQLDRIRFEGLGRLVRISAVTMGLDRLDINALMPLWSGGISQKQEKALIKLLHDEAHFWRPNGVTMTSASDPNFDPSNANGGGGVWLFWATLMGEALLTNGEEKAVVDLVQRLLAVQTHVYMQKGAFSEFYHSDQPIGSGETGNLAGIIPLHLLHRLWGVTIRDGGTVDLQGEYRWGEPITIVQHGVTVKRDSKQTHITFASGTTLTVENRKELQTLHDSAPIVTTPIIPNLYPPASTAPAPQTPPNDGTVIIPIDTAEE